MEKLPELVPTPEKKENDAPSSVNKEEFIKNGSGIWKKVYLTEEDYGLHYKELAKKYGLSPASISHVRKNGYLTVRPDGYSEAFAQKRNEKKREREEMNISVQESLPKNQRDFFAGDYHFNIGAVKTGPAGQLRKEYIIDGIKTNSVELFINEQLTKLKSRRTKEGALEIFDKEKNSFIPFSPKSFHRLSERRLSLSDVDKDGKTRSISLDSQGFYFAKKHLSNLLENGILRREDFKVRGNSNSYEQYGLTERKLKHGLNEFVFTGENGTLKYYIGRNKITGTHKEINPETMAIIQLDKNTFAITEKNVLNQKKILYTFEGVSKEEYTTLRKTFLDARQGDERIKDEGYVCASLRAETKGRIKEYKPESFLGKSSKDASLLDVEFVTKTVRELAGKHSIPILNLKWAEQLEIVALLSDLSKDKQKQFETFLSAYNLEGLRSFLSLEHGGKEMGGKILALGEALPKEEAQKIFAHYSKIVDTTNTTLNFLVTKYHKENTAPEIVQKIQNTLLEKGVTLLRDTSQALEKKKDAKEVSQGIIALLDQYQENILLFASTFKTLSEEEKDLSLEDVAGTEIQKLTTSDIERYKADIVAINRDNRKGFMSERELAQRTYRLLETLKKDNVQFYGTTFDGKLISFVSFEEQSDGSLLAESLNVAPSIKQSHIGNAFFETLIKDLGKEKDIYGYVHKKNADKLSFYEKLGFVTTTITKDDGSQWYMIRYHTDAGEAKLAA